MTQTVVVLGARNLGGALAEQFLDLGWNATAVARSEETLERVRRRGTLSLAADASDPAVLTEALEVLGASSGQSMRSSMASARAETRAGGPFDGGNLVSVDLGAFRG